MASISKRLETHNSWTTAEIKAFKKWIETPQPFKWDGDIPVKDSERVSWKPKRKPRKYTK